MNASNNLRVAIYARYSTDLQNPTSLDDQIRLCEGRVKEGEQIVARYADAGVSHADMEKRHQFKLLRAAIRNRYIDVVVCERFDRLSRSIHGSAEFYHFAQHHQVDIRTLDRDRLTLIDFGFTSLMGASEIEILKDRIFRGQVGASLRGKKIARTYGYVAAPIISSDGRVEKGNRKLHPEQAAVVRRIFDEFNSGHSLARIARTLNKENIPSPMRKLWSPMQISRRTNSACTSAAAPDYLRVGILSNEMYIGKVVWNRIRSVKNYSTGVTQYIIKPKSEWTSVNMPHLRIIDDDTWYAAQERLRARENVYRCPSFYKRKEPMLSFQINCPNCGSNLISAGRFDLICLKSKKFGVCTATSKINVVALHASMKKLILDVHKGKADSKIIQRVDLQLVKDEIAERAMEINNLKTALSKTGCDTVVISNLIKEKQVESDDLVRKFEKYLRHSNYTKSEFLTALARTRCSKSACRIFGRIVRRVEYRIEPGSSFEITKINYASDIDLIGCE